MERVALDLCARDRGVQEIQVEEGVVPDENRTGAISRAHGVAHLAKNPLQRILFGDRGPQRMVRIDPGHGQRSGLHVGAWKRRHVITMRFTARQGTVAAHFDEHGRNLEQGVRLRIEATGFHVDHDRQETAKARRERDGWERHSPTIGSSRQAIVSPPR